jgi:hypothetical protein
MRRVLLLSVLLVSCSGRASLPLDKSHLGHWQADTVTHCYFSPTHKITVIGDKVRKDSYRIDRVDNNESMMIITINVNEAMPIPYKFLFTSDKQQMTERYDYSLAGIQPTITQWKYVDSKQEH